MDEKVSVIVPVYKVEPYLEKCVRSIINQTYRNIEIILVDDGSPDRCPQMCDAFATQDERIIVIHKENGGLSSARNAGLDAATGGYILFVDSDDWIAPETVEKTLAVILEEKSDMVMFNLADVYDDKGTILPHNSFAERETWTQDEFWQAEYKGDLGVCGVVSVSKLYVRKLFSITRFRLGKIHEDEFLLNDVIPMTKKISFLNEPLYFYYRRQSGNIMSERKYQSFYDAASAYVERAVLLENEGKMIFASSVMSSSLFLYAEFIAHKKWTKEEKSKMLAVLNSVKRYSLRKNAAYMTKNEWIKILAFKISPNLFLLLNQINYLMRRGKE